MAGSSISQMVVSVWCCPGAPVWCCFLAGIFKVVVKFIGVASSHLHFTLTRLLLIEVSSAFQFSLQAI